MSLRLQIIGFNGETKSQLKFHIIRITIFKYNKCFVLEQHYQGSQCDKCIIVNYFNVTWNLTMKLFSDKIIWVGNTLSNLQCQRGTQHCYPRRLTDDCWFNIKKVVIMLALMILQYSSTVVNSWIRKEQTVILFWLAQCKNTT